ncbi:carboxymuconolactone decarboxylase family protein [Mycobacterium sp. 48b]|uniref:carboxymuconolactone decarboxylase family protein n=1 Tax=Mycobacterium sp. 48b TaxID=3400426 RepID=UPI003AACC10F
MTHFSPLPLDQWPVEMRDAMSAMTPPNPRYVVSRRPDGPKALNILGMLAHHPALAKAFFTFNGHLLRATTLSERQRELLILRAAAVRGAEYEFAQHLVLGQDAGVSAEEIPWIAWGPDASIWTESDAALLRATDELISAGAIDSDTLSTLSQHLDVRQILDVIFTVGAYETLGWMLQSFEVELDEDIRKAIGVRESPS